MLAEALCTFTEDSREFQVRQAWGHRLPIIWQFSGEQNPKTIKILHLPHGQIGERGGRRRILVPVLFQLTLPRGSISPVCKTEQVKPQFLREMS